MFFEISSIILLIVVLELLINQKISTNISSADSKNLDKKILYLRDVYKKISLDKRIPIDLCNEDYKLGNSRDSKKESAGNNCEPWISRESIFVLDHILPINGTGLEWSSGSSII